MTASHPPLMPAAGTLPPLENGDQLTQAEFLRRYEDMAGLKKAELIEGIVHTPSPASHDHARPDGVIHSWPGTYAARHGLEVLPNVTLLLDADNAPQPDTVLRTPPRDGGRVWMNDKHYLCGAPELVVEIAASSVSIDLRDKLRAYRRNGISEQLVWRVQDGQIDWFVLEEGQYVALTPDTNGRSESRVFPGLMLDVPAALGQDRQTVPAALGL